MYQLIRSSRQLVQRTQPLSRVFRELIVNYSSLSKNMLQIEKLATCPQMATLAVESAQVYKTLIETLVETSQLLILTRNRHNTEEVTRGQSGGRIH